MWVKTRLYAAACIRGLRLRRRLLHLFLKDHQPTPKFMALLTRRESAYITKMCVYASQTTLLSGSTGFLESPPKESKRRKRQ
jgi:hypothetical protein